MIRRSKASCPSCKGALETLPKRKKKCPNCGNYIYVRNGRLLTEEQALTEDWLRRIECLGVTNREFDRHHKTLANQYGFKPPLNDVKWRILNSLVSGRRPVDEIKTIYLEMAAIAKEEGKNPKPYLAEAARQELLGWKREGIITRVKITTCNDHLVCPACNSLAQRTYTIDQALAEMPIPNACQSKDGCRCWYIGLVG